MKNILTLSLTLSFALAAQAQLTPQTEAPLYRHMQEVNAQWQTMMPAMAQDDAPVHFNTEAERIAKHLHLVAAHLRSASPEGLSAAAASERATLLNDLDNYADRGLFPQNHVLPYRNPVFIDPYGTACAVGQLMIESGHRDLAESVSEEMNLAYVHDMKRPDVLQWAVEEGFTEDELAWIQPGYPPTLNWSPLGGGTNGPVKVMLNLPSGNVLIAGEFSEAGGVPVQNVAILQGQDFLPLGPGVQGTITCGAVSGTDIYLGGYNINGINDLAHWDGSQWEYSTVFDGKMPIIFALHVLNDTLYAAGETQGFAGADEYVKRNTGSGWQPMAGNFNTPIRCLGSHDGRLVAGGDFNSVVVGGPALPVEHVAIHGPNGWTQLGDGLNGPVLTLLDVQGTLYAGGRMFANIAPLFGLARIGPGAESWEPLMPNLADYISIGPGSAEVRTLLSDGDQVYIGGDFGMQQFTLVGQHLARFLGTPDNFEPLAYFNAPVNALASNPFVSDAFSLYAGGEFTFNVGDAVPYLGEALLNTSIHGVTEDASISLHPNPAADHLTIDLGDGASANARIELLDVQGRTVQTHTAVGPTATLDIASLAAGSYAVRVVSENGIRSQTFIKR
ncbi:MAG: T9SS type A sorting domain-containing protein [Flavobacteriales bacterium]